MSEDDKKLCYKAIEVMTRHGYLGNLAGHTLRRMIERGEPQIIQRERRDVPPYKRMNA